jgi:hypothetical protein
MSMQWDAAFSPGSRFWDFLPFFGTEAGDLD